LIAPLPPKSPRKPIRHGHRTHPDALPVIS
jgi:hypothetical protein